MADMKAKEYLNKAATICELHDKLGECRTCPLRKYACGLPQKDAEQKECIKFVKEFKQPLECICPRCKNEEFPAGARFCPICGLEASGQEQKRGKKNG